jgi:hypothetical protein
MTAPELEREVTRRLGRDPFVGATRQWIEGVVRRSDDHFEVELFERDVEGRTLGARTLREATGDCRKLDEAIVLAIALIIDPSARLAPPLPRESAPVRPIRGVSSPSDSSPPSPGGDVASTRAGLPIRESSPASVVVPPDAPTPKRTREKPSVTTALARPLEQVERANAYVGLDAIAVVGVLPGVAPGVEAVTRVAFGSRDRYALRVSALYLPDRRPESTFGDFSYGLTALEAGGCMGSQGRRAVWFGCGGFQLGAIHAIVHDPAPFEPGERLWLAFRLEAGMALHLAGPLWLETRLFDLLAPRRWVFRVREAGEWRTTFEQKAWMPGAAIGLGLKMD